MGKTKIKVVDDSAQAEEKKPAKKKVRKETLDDRKLKLDIETGSSKLEDQASNIQPQDQTSSFQRPASKSTKPGKAKPRSKKYQEVTKDLDRTKTYPIPEAVEMVKKLSYSKFEGSLEVHINTTQTGVRGLVLLPFVSGKKLKILAFGKGAQGCGADIVGDDSTIDTISDGKIDFDLTVTTPEWMPKLAKVARILGPRGLMPNPKNGTISDDLKKAVESFQAGKTEYEHSSKQVYKTEPKAPIIHLPLGKLNQPTDELSQNVKTLLSTLGRSKIKKVSLSPTMGPSVKVDLASF